MLSLFNFRTIVAIVFLFVFFVLFYYYNESLDNIVSLEREKSKFQQGVDTMSAQLQVVYEHKSRLEKLLQQEKNDFQLYKTDQERIITSLRQKAEKLKKQHDDLKAENDKISAKYESMRMEKEQETLNINLKLEKANKESVLVQQRIQEINSQIETLRLENFKLKKRIQQNSRTNEAKSVKVHSQMTHGDTGISADNVNINDLLHSNIFNVNTTNDVFTVKQSIPDKNFVLKRPDEGAGAKSHEIQHKLADNLKNAERESKLLDNDDVIFERPNENGKDNMALQAPNLRQAQDNEEFVQKSAAGHSKVLAAPESELEGEMEDLPEAHDKNDEKEII